MDSIIVGRFKPIGEQVIDLGKVVSRWNHLWVIIQWKETYRIVKNIRKDSQITELKLTISENQAKQLIDMIGLKPTKGFFRSATSWRDQRSLTILNA